VKQSALPLAVIVLVVALLAYAVVYGRHDDTPVNPSPQRSAAATLSAQAKFVSPLNGTDVANPIEVRMAIGGVKFEPATKSPAPGEGHLYLIIDGGPPSQGSKLSGQRPDIDLSDASHDVTLPALTQGKHRLTLLFVDSADVFQNSLLTDSVTINVTG